MKKTSRKVTRQGMRAEYEFDYRQGRPNRFATRLNRDVVSVVLDPDVAAVFQTAESVNELLRSVIMALPGHRRVKVGRKKGTV